MKRAFRWVSLPQLYGLMPRFARVDAGDGIGAGCYSGWVAISVEATIRRHFQ